MENKRIERALKRATDTKACVIGEDVLPQVAALFREWFPGAARAMVVCDPRTRAAAGERVGALLREAGVVCPCRLVRQGGPQLAKARNKIDVGLDIVYEPSRFPCGHVSSSHLALREQHIYRRHLQTG